MATEEEWLNGAMGLAPLVTGEVIWRRLVGTKSRVWEHEKEWRVVTKRRLYERVGFEDCPFYPEEISRIFLGCNISDEDKAATLSLLSGSLARVEAYQAVQHPKKFALTFERIS
jgi:hypothetical protein